MCCDWEGPGESLNFVGAQLVPRAAQMDELDEALKVIASGNKRTKVTMVADMSDSNSSQDFPASDDYSSTQGSDDESSGDDGGGNPAPQAAPKAVPAPKAAPAAPKAAPAPPAPLAHPPPAPLAHPPPLVAPPPGGEWWGPFLVSRVRSHGRQTGWGIVCGRHLNSWSDLRCKRQLRGTDASTRRKLIMWACMGESIATDLDDGKDQHFGIAPRGLVELGDAELRRRCEAIAS